MRRGWLCGVLFWALPLQAQIPPSPGSGDPRIQTARYDPNLILQLQVAAGYQLTLILNRDEAIQTVAIGEGGGWQITPSKRGDTLFIKSDLTARQTNLSVITTARSYAFELIPVATVSAQTTYQVQLTYPETVTRSTSPAVKPRAAGSYRFTGSKPLIPKAMSDDGQKTYIEWDTEQTLPAVFVIDETGQEALIDGYMREGLYTIDAIRDRFVFRLDDEVARAKRMVVKSR